MPWSFPAEVTPICSDAARYARLVESGLQFRLLGYDAFLCVDFEATPTFDQLLLLRNDLKEFIYSCYVVSVRTPNFGMRVVQREVRQHADYAGLAGGVMRAYFLERDACLRTDVALSLEGQAMWRKFVESIRHDKDFVVFKAKLECDCRTESGQRNQNAALVETVTEISPLGSARVDDLFHSDRKQSNLDVIYVMKVGKVCD